MKLELGVLKHARAPFWLLIFLLVSVVLTGGSSRGDVQSLVFLRPISFFMVGFAIWTLRKNHRTGHEFLFGLAVAVLVLSALFLVPLPISGWSAFPHSHVVTEIDRSISPGVATRTLAVSPLGAWNSFCSMVVPLGVLMLGVQLSREERFRLLPFLVLIGLLSGLLGVVQAISNPNSALYFYNITNNGSAVGFFANRNHQALLLALLFPMLAVYASESAKIPEHARLRGWAAIAAGAVLIPLILVTGSRSGLILGVVSLGSAFILYHQPFISNRAPRSTQRSVWQLPLAGFAVVMLGLLTIMMSRAEAIRRLFDPERAEEGRFEFWGAAAKVADQYFPVGTGPGSFVEAYGMVEPNELAKATYLNHAHNDWLEAYISFSIAGILIASVVIIALVRSGWRLLSVRNNGGREVNYAVLGCFMLVIIALSSIGDYPVRTPIFQSILVIAALWMSDTSSAASQNAALRRKKMEQPAAVR